MDLNKKEIGAAGLQLTLSDGELTVEHSEGSVLLQGDIPRGGWDKIIEAILEACPDGTGYMAVNRESDNG